MPQLNPAPWLAILVFSELVFLTVVVPKTLSHTFPNSPTPQSTKTPKTESENEPWT
uniref:ATP synthase complex subunit 8 n=1 Tax=Acentrogobius viridipunctatus TaxID=508006 RepID=A0A343EQT0_9GOBI|nr:ATP synthase F0 subunit 8 [Acentrogobius viridipunctatus]